MSKTNDINTEYLLDSPLKELKAMLNDQTKKPKLADLVSLSGAFLEDLREIWRMKLDLGKYQLGTSTDKTKICFCDIVNRPRVWFRPPVTKESSWEAILLTLFDKNNRAAYPISKIDLMIYGATAMASVLSVVALLFTLYYRCKICINQNARDQEEGETSQADYLMNTRRGEQLVNVQTNRSSRTFAEPPRNLVTVKAIVHKKRVSDPRRQPIMDLKRLTNPRNHPVYDVTETTTITPIIREQPSLIQPRSQGYYQSAYQPCQQPSYQPSSHQGPAEERHHGPAEERHHVDFQLPNEDQPNLGRNFSGSNHENQPNETRNFSGSNHSLDSNAFGGSLRKLN